MKLERSSCSSNFSVFVGLLIVNSDSVNKRKFNRIIYDVIKHFFLRWNNPKLLGNNDKALWGTVI